jgi:hypothetical protein
MPIVTSQKQGKDRSLVMWTRLSWAAIVVLVVVVWWIGRVIEPPPRPSQPVLTTAEEPRQPVAEAPAVIPGIVADQGFRPVPIVGPNASLTSSPELKLTMSSFELSRHLESQAAILRREAENEAGNSNGLTPTAAEIETLVREQRVIQ